MVSLADNAVAYLLDRIQDDGRLAYYFGHTESLKLLCEAHAAANGLDAETFKREFEGSLLTEPPRCRSGECAQRPAP